MVKRIETRWKNLQPDGIAAAMTGISQRAERWLSDRSDKSTSLWDALAQSIWPRRRIDKRDRTWLRTIFVDNRRNVQGLFRERVDSVLFEPVTPLAKSTPRPKQQKYCVCQKRYNASEDSLIECNGCQEWYHAVCINTDFSSAAADSSWRCPRCLGLPHARFPDGWEESIQQPRQPLGISSIPLTLDEGNSIQESGFESRLVDVTTKGHVIEATTTDDVSSFTEVSSCSDSDSNYASIRCSKSRIGILDSCSSDSENETTGTTHMKDSFHVGKPKTCLGNTCDGTYSAQVSVKLPEDTDVNAEYTHWKLPSVIYIEVTLQVWQSFVYTKSNGVQRLKNGWTDYFRDKIGVVIPQCGLTFECHKLYPSKTAHFHASGYCKGENCISFVLSGAAPPTENEPMRVSMIITGVCRHKYGETFRTRIQNRKRDEIKAKLTNATSASVATELHRKADMEAVDGGNMTSLPARKLLRQMRYEMNAGTDFSKDPLHDLQLMIQKDVKDKGTFIRFYASVPKFQVVCFLDRSLDVLDMMRKFKHRTGQADGYLSLKPHHDALVVDNGFLQKDVEDLQAKLHVQPMDAGSSSQQDQDESVEHESFLQHYEEVIPQREETRTERRSRIQRESRKTEKGKLKMKRFREKKRSEHRPRKRDQKK
ncbi:unnamed protein product [Allacma fusca]|uniref:PHD-type domain-containing protein n=1 Tax=Allacma fusca TaxID=39272 RepID=A0A8J2NI89_9HEXA|nr:unnamed protein product [Allacma fusca]